MSERSFIQPAEARVFRDIYDKSTFYADSAVEASNLAYRIVDASGLLGEAMTNVPSELHADTIVGPSGRSWYVGYEAPSPDVPNYHNTSTALLSFTFRALERGFGVGVRANVKDRAGIIPTLEASAGVPVQAFDRRLTLSYDHPLATIEAASELALDTARERIEEQAKHSTFAGLLEYISVADDRLQRENEFLLAYLQAIPEAAVHVHVLREQTAAGALTAHHLGLALSDVAKTFYMQGSAARQTELVDVASTQLQNIYAWAEPDFQYPYTFTFGPERFHDPMSKNRLTVPIDWRDHPLDNRLAVAAQVAMDGTYDLREHIFTPAERGRGLSNIEFNLRRAAVTPDSTEADLGPVLDAQMMALAGDRITSEKKDEYVQSLQADPAPYPTKSGDTDVQTKWLKTAAQVVNMKLIDYF